MVSFENQPLGDREAAVPKTAKLGGALLTLILRGRCFNRMIYFGSLAIWDSFADFMDERSISTGVAPIKAEYMLVNQTNCSNSNSAADS